VLDAEMNTPAMPTDSSTSAGSTWVAKPESAGIRVSHSMPRTPSVSPPTISGLGPVLGSSCDTAAAARMTPPLNGRNANPVCSGE
jgi:hypothetical protein